MTLNAKLAAYFQARPNRWINARELLTVAGFAAWRSRIADIRKPPFSMQIENRWRVERGYRVSEYRFVPNEMPQQKGDVRGHPCHANAQ